MAGPWEPDEEFLEFLEALQEAAGASLMIGGRPIVDEMRDGTDLGRKFYEKMYADPELKAVFEEWKFEK